MKFLDWLQSDSAMAAGRNVVSAACAVGATIGILTATQSHDLIQAWSDVQSGLAQAAKGMSIIAGIIGVPAMAWWASHRASPAVQQKTVAQMPNTLVVTTAPATPTIGAPSQAAADNAAITRLAATIATHPEVQQVLTTPAVENATTSDKVVSDPSHGETG